MTEKRIVVGISGASGLPVALELLKALKKCSVEVHAIPTGGAFRVAQHELGMDEKNFAKELKSLACRVYDEQELQAPVASGTFKHDGMVVVPCSMKTLASIATGLEVNLLARAASVTLKEKRKLVLCVRETPLRAAHLRNMLMLAEEGAIILPLVMSFYGKRDGRVDVGVMIRNLVGKVMDLLGVDYEYERWC